MKIAVPTRKASIDDHFGHCEAYTIFSVSDDKEIVSTETLPSPQGCGCKSNIASVFQGLGVSVMLAGNMGNGALNVLTQHDIKVFRGNSGDARETVERYLQGAIKDSGESCSHHGDDHQCNH